MPDDYYTLSLFLRFINQIISRSAAPEKKNFFKAKKNSIVLGLPPNPIPFLPIEEYLTSFTDGGLEIWKYELSNMSADAVNYVPIVNFFGSSTSGTKKELVVLYDDKGIVKRCSMSESPVSIKTGAFR